MIYPTHLRCLTDCKNGIARKIQMWVKKKTLSPHWEILYWQDCKVLLKRTHLNINYTKKNSEYMMTSSNGNIFHVTGLVCGNSLVTGEFPSQMPVTRSFDVFFYLRLNKRLSKQSGGWWFETPARSLWLHCNLSPDNALLQPHEILYFVPTSHEFPFINVSNVIILSRM